MHMFNDLSTSWWIDDGDHVSVGLALDGAAAPRSHYKGCT